MKMDDKMMEMRVTEQISGRISEILREKSQVFYNLEEEKFLFEDVFWELLNLSYKFSMLEKFKFELIKPLK